MNLSKQKKMSSIHESINVHVHTHENQKKKSFQENENFYSKFINVQISNPRLVFYGANNIKQTS